MSDSTQPITVEQAVDAALDTASEPSAPVSDEIVTPDPNVAARRSRSRHPRVNPVIAELEALLAGNLPADNESVVLARKFIADSPKRTPKTTALAESLKTALTALIAARPASRSNGGVRRMPGEGKLKGLILFGGATANPDVYYNEGGRALKLWQIHKPENNIRGSFLFGGGAGKNGSMWIVRNTDPALWTVEGTKLTAKVPLSEIDSPHFTKRSEAEAEADRRWAAYQLTPAFRKVTTSKAKLAEHIAHLEAAAKARVASDGTAR